MEVKIIQKLSEPWAGVKCILVTLSSRGFVFDLESLKHSISQIYPEAVIFFQSTLGKPVGGASPPRRVDLLIDFTGPCQRQSYFSILKWRRMARFAVGRRVGLIRKFVYDRVWQEQKALLHKPILERERIAQEAVLHLAGIPLEMSGDLTMDRSHLPLS